MSRDAFLSFRGNLYSVPWRMAGQEVTIREADGHLHIQKGKERLAVHPLAPSGSHQRVTIPSHHEGIPLGDAGRGGKQRIVIGSNGSGSQGGEMPVVEVRSLLAYEECYSSEEEVNHG